MADVAQEVLSADDFAIRTTPGGPLSLGGGGYSARPGAVAMPPAGISRLTVPRTNPAYRPVPGGANNIQPFKRPGLSPNPLAPARPVTPSQPSQPAKPTRLPLPSPQTPAKLPSPLQPTPNQPAKLPSPTQPPPAPTQPATPPTQPATPATPAQPRSQLPTPTPQTPTPPTPQTPAPQAPSPTPNQPVTPQGLLPPIPRPLDPFPQPTDPTPSPLSPTPTPSTPAPLPPGKTPAPMRPTYKGITYWVQYQIRQILNNGSYFEGIFSGFYQGPIWGAWVEEIPEYGKQNGYPYLGAVLAVGDPYYAGLAAGGYHRSMTIQILDIRWVTGTPEAPTAPVPDAPPLPIPDFPPLPPVQPLPGENDIKPTRRWPKPAPTPEPAPTPPAPEPPQPEPTPPTEPAPPEPEPTPTEPSEPEPETPTRRLPPPPLPEQNPPAPTPNQPEKVPPLPQPEPPAPIPDEPIPEPSPPVPSPAPPLPQPETPPEERPDFPPLPEPIPPAPMPAPVPEPLPTPIPEPLPEQPPTPEPKPKPPPPLPLPEPTPDPTPNQPGPEPGQAPTGPPTPAPEPEPPIDPNPDPPPFPTPFPEPEPTPQWPPRPDQPADPPSKAPKPDSLPPTPKPQTPPAPTPDPGPDPYAPEPQTPTDPNPPPTQPPGDPYSPTPNQPGDSPELEPSPPKTEDPLSMPIPQLPTSTPTQPAGGAPCDKNGDACSISISKKLDLTEFQIQQFSDFLQTLYLADQLRNIDLRVQGLEGLLQEIIARLERIEANTIQIGETTDENLLTSQINLGATQQNVQMSMAGIGLMGPRLRGGLSRQVTRVGGAVGAVKTQLNRVARFLRLGKIFEILTFILALHNAYFLSRNIVESVGDLVATGLQVIGIKDENGNPIDINEIVGDSVTDWMKSIIGAENFTEIKNTIAKWSRIYQAASNMLWSVYSMLDSISEVIEWTSENTGKIGNALKSAGVVFNNSYRWLPEKLNSQNKSRIKFQRMIDGLEAVDDTASSLYMVTSEVREIQENIQELGEQRQAFKTLIEDAIPQERPDNNPVKAREESAAMNSAAPNTEESDLEPDTDTLTGG